MSYYTNICQICDESNPDYHYIQYCSTKCEVLGKALNYIKELEKRIVKLEKLIDIKPNDVFIDI